MNTYEKEYIMKGFYNKKINVNILNDGFYNIILIKAISLEKALIYAKSSYPNFDIKKIYELVEK